MNSGGGAYTYSGSVVYYMPGYSPYATGAMLGVNGQQPYFSSSEAMPCYSWNNSTYSGDMTHRNAAASSSLGSKSGTGSNGMKSNDYNSKRTMSNYTGKSTNYLLDLRSRQHSTSTVPKSILQSQHTRSLHKSGSAYQSRGHSKGYQQPSGNFSSYGYQNQGLYSNYSMNYASGGRLWKETDRYNKSREKTFMNGESAEELTHGPRSQSVSLHLEDDTLGMGMSLKQDKYNLEDFKTKYDNAKFYVIKSYSEVHKSIKYDVWSSTPSINKKLDAAYCDADRKTNNFCFLNGRRNRCLFAEEFKIKRG